MSPSECGKIYVCALNEVHWSRKSDVALYCSTINTRIDLLRIHINNLCISRLESSRCVGVWESIKIQYELIASWQILASFYRCDFYYCMIWDIFSHKGKVPAQPCSGAWGIQYHALVIISRRFIWLWCLLENWMYDQLHQVKLTDPVTYAGALVNYSFWHIRCRAFLTMYMAIN